MFKTPIVKSHFAHKYILSLCTIAILFILTATPLLADTVQRSDWGSIGLNDKNELGFSIGTRLPDAPIGFELGGSSDFKYLGINDYPCPHDDYTVINNDSLKLTFGGDALVFLDLSPNVSIYGGVGVYFIVHREVVESNATYWLYEQETSTEIKAVYSYGIQFRTDNNFGFGIGYHSLRGINCQFIARF